MLAAWLPAYEFSHLILFLVGLWALLDKESLEAVVSVSLHHINYTVMVTSNSPPSLVHCGVGIYHLTGHYSVGAVLS